MDPAELLRFLGHTELVNAAWAFLISVCVDGDLLSVWPNVDPDFRAVFAQRWVRDNHYQMTVDGWEGEAVDSALSGPVPDHPLWVHFERVHCDLPGDAAGSGDVGNRYRHQDRRPRGGGALRARRLGAGGRPVGAERFPVRCFRSSCISSTGGRWCGIWGRRRTLRLPPEPTSVRGGGEWLPAPGYLSSDAVKPHAG